MVQRTASYLDYSSPLVFLEGMLSELVCRWLDEGDMDKFPYCLLEQPSLKEFYRYRIAVSSCSFTTVAAKLCQIHMIMIISCCKCLVAHNNRVVCGYHCLYCCQTVTLKQSNGMHGVVCFLHFAFVIFRFQNIFVKDHTLPNSLRKNRDPRLYCCTMWAAIIRASSALP